MQDSELHSYSYRLETNDRRGEVRHEFSFVEEDSSFPNNNILQEPSIIHQTQIIEINPQYHESRYPAINTIGIRSNAALALDLSRESTKARLLVFGF